MAGGRKILVTLPRRNAPTFSRNLAARDGALIDESTFISRSLSPPRLFLNYGETPSENANVGEFANITPARDFSLAFFYCQRTIRKSGDGKRATSGDELRRAVSSRLLSIFATLADSRAG